MIKALASLTVVTTEKLSCISLHTHRHVLMEKLRIAKVEIQRELNEEFGRQKALHSLKGKCFV